MTLQPHKVFVFDENNSVLVLMVKTKHRLELFCTPEQYAAGVAAYRRGTPAQEAFHFLSVEERSFLFSGMLPEYLDSLSDG